MTNIPEWTDEQIALLGTDSDEAIAIELGTSTYAVREQRRRLKIKPAKKVRFTPDIIKLLGRLPDATIAEMIGATEKHVAYKRSQAKISRSVSGLSRSHRVSLDFFEQVAEFDPGLQQAYEKLERLYLVHKQLRRGLDISEFARQIGVQESAVKRYLRILKATFGEIETFKRPDGRVLYYSSDQ